MPDLPQIFAQPNTPYQGHIPQTTPDTFGAGVFAKTAEVADALLKQKDAQDLVDAQLALDARDQVYQQHRLEIKTNPGEYGNKTADTFINDWNAKAKEDDAAILNDLNPEVKKHAGVLFARLQRKEFDQQFNDYRQIWVDQSRGKLLASANDMIQRIAQEPDPAIRDYYHGTLNGMLDAAAVSGIFPAEEIANKKINVNSDIETVQANNLMLNKSVGGPQQVLANLQTPGVWANIKPDRRDALIANATRMAKMNENEAAKTTRESQDGMFRVLSRLAEKNDLSPETIKTQENINGIRPDQARELMGLAGRPTYAVSPGAVNQIMSERVNAGEWTVANNEVARQKLRNLDPHDPAVTAAMTVLNNSDRSLKSSSHGLQTTQAVREFKDSVYSGNKTVLQHFSLPGLQFQHSQVYSNAINHLEAQLGRGVPKDQAIKEALDMVRPKAGARQTPGQAVLDFIGE